MWKNGKPKHHCSTLPRRASTRSRLPARTDRYRQRYVLDWFDHGRAIYQLGTKFLPDDVLSSRPSTPTIRKLGGPSSRPGTPNISTPTAARGNAALHALNPKQPIQTPQQFYDWFTLIDQSVARSQESHFHAHLETVTSHVEMCDNILERIELLEREVTDMLEGWRGVEEGGKSLKDACERLLVEKVSSLFIL